MRLQRAIHNKQNTAVFSPHSFTNIYHFLEGTSQMVRLVLHPELFPRVPPIQFISRTDRSCLDLPPAFLRPLQMALFSGIRVSGPIFEGSTPRSPHQQGRQIPKKGPIMVRAVSRRVSKLGLQGRRQFLPRAARRRFDSCCGLSESGSFTSEAIKP